MISPEERAALVERVKKGDYVQAALIYKENTGMEIASRTLLHYLKFTPSNEGFGVSKHDPGEKYRAVLLAVVRRERKEKEATEAARQLRETM